MARLRHLGHSPSGGNGDLNAVTSFVDDYGQAIKCLVMEKLSKANEKYGKIDADGRTLVRAPRDDMKAPGMI